MIYTALCPISTQESRMSRNFEANLQLYAQLLVKIGLNLQPGQRLLINAPLPSAPLVEQLVISAYQNGARLVDVFYGDERVTLARFQYAPRDSFSEVAEWYYKAALESAERGDAVLQIAGADPGLLKDQDPGLVQTYTLARSQAAKPFSNYVMRDALNWLIAAYPTASWAARVFPDVPADQREAKLWDAIFEVCRITQPDPLAAWETHLAQLATWGRYLNQKQYAALHYTASGTDLTIGLPRQHAWMSGRTQTPSGIEFTANIPTEEIFSLPHKDQISGVVHASKPLSYNGTLIEDFSLTFEAGRVVDLKAAQGEAVLRNMINTDAGAASLGEVALVPHNSPISQSGLLFFNTLFDENAACHIALGRGIRYCLEGGTELSDEEFAARGGNDSLIHVDFMIGSDQMNIDGLLPNGGWEPIMRSGEWAFSV
jgi:aminopeptidase